MRSDERRRLGTGRVIGLHEDDGAFDRAFWGAIPPHERLEAVWGLTLDSSPCRVSVSINSDFRDLFAALNAAAVKCLLVGGYALAVHAAPRFTKDIDVWIEPTPENAARVMTANASTARRCGGCARSRFAGSRKPGSA